MVATLAALFVLLRSGEVYTAQSTFTPTETSQQLGGSGAGRILGLSIAGVNLDPSSSLDFYATLLRSRHLLEQAVRTEYSLAAPDGAEEVLSGDLPTLMGVEGSTPEQREAAAVRRLRDQISVGTSPSAGLVVLDVRFARPELALAVNRRLLELVDEFNTQRQVRRRQSEEEFLRQRLGEALNEMRSAERELEAFLVRNRQYQESPELSLEAQRLQRQVQFRQNMYFTLAQAHEQARIDAIRTMPFVSVVDPPGLEVSRPASRVLVAALFGLFLGALIALAVIVTREFFRQQRQRETREYAEFEELWAGARHRMNPRRFWRRARS